MHGVKLFVRQVNGRWTIGRENLAFQKFASYELALARAREFEKKGAEIIVVGTPGTAKRPPSGGIRIPRGGPPADRRLYVRRDDDGRWIWRRRGATVEAFDTKALAVQAAVKFVMTHPEIELVVDDSPGRGRPLG